MEIDWDLLLRALCLMAILEGILPFVSPMLCKHLSAQLVRLDDTHLRVIGAVMMGIGLLLLIWF